MVSDDELKRHIESHERIESSATEARLTQLEEHTRMVHDELIHRIEAARANAATRDDLSDIVERLDDIERRLDALETEE